jgi:hypothetical protein
MPTQSPDNNRTVITLSDTLDKSYKVDIKDLTPPTTVPEGYPDEGVKINWVTKFGFKPRNPKSIPADKLDKEGFMKGDIGEYTVKIRKDGNRLWCWDGKLSELSYIPIMNTPDVEAKLKKGDPALGWT